MNVRRNQHANVMDASVTTNGEASNANALAIVYTWKNKTLVLVNVRNKQSWSITLIVFLFCFCFFFLRREKRIRNWMVLYICDSSCSRKYLCRWLRVLQVSSQGMFIHVCFSYWIVKLIVIMNLSDDNSFSVSKTPKCQSYMDSEIMAIMSQYMPLESQNTTDPTTGESQQLRLTSAA